MRDRYPLSALQQPICRFCEARDWDHYRGPKDVAFGIALGAAELLAHFRFLSEERAHGALTDPSGREAVEDELAEALFFVLRFAQRFGVDIAGRLKRTFAMNAARYPVKKSRVRSAKCPES